MAVKGGEFVVTHRRPFRAQLPKPLHPSLPILTLETGGFPDQEEPIVRKQGSDAPHEVLFRIRTQMVKRLANPYDMDRFVPAGDRLDEILAAKVNRTAKVLESCAGHFQRWPRNVDADVAAYVRALQRLGRAFGRAAGDVQIDEPIRRFGRQNPMKKSVHLSVRHVVVAHDLFVGRKPLRKECLIALHALLLAAVLRDA